MAEQYSELGQTSMMERFGGKMPLPQNNHLSSVSTFVLEHTENIELYAIFQLSKTKTLETVVIWPRNET